MDNNKIALYTGSTEVTERTQRIDELTDSFILSQDVKESSKKLYRRTLKQYFNWVKDNRLQLEALIRADIIKYKEDLFSLSLIHISEPTRPY